MIHTSARRQRTSDNETPRQLSCLHYFSPTALHYFYNTATDDAITEYNISPWWLSGGRPAQSPTLIKWTVHASLAVNWFMGSVMTDHNKCSKTDSPLSSVDSSSSSVLQSQTHSHLRRSRYLFMFKSPRSFAAPRFLSFDCSTLTSILLMVSVLVFLPIINCFTFSSP